MATVTFGEMKKIEAYGLRSTFHNLKLNNVQITFLNNLQDLDEEVITRQDSVKITKKPILEDQPE